MGIGAEQREASDRVRIDGYDLPCRTGARPETLCGPLHIQCAGHGDPKFLEQLVSDVPSWPHIEARPASPDIIPIRLEQGAAPGESESFLSAREFARVMFGAPTIYLALPLIWGSLGDCTGMGRAALPRFFWIAAGRSGCRLHAEGSGRIVCLPFLVSRGLPFCL